MENSFEIDVKNALRENKLKGIEPSTQTQLAEDLGITSPYLSDILKGYRVGVKQRNQIKKILDLESDRYEV